MKKQLTDIPVEGKTVLLRVDFNVPIVDGVIIDDLRMVAALKTIQYLREHHARVIIMTHIGRPKGRWDPQLSTHLLAQHLAELLACNVVWVADIVGLQAKGLRDVLHDSDIAMLENLRFDPREEANDAGFSKELAFLGDIYCNDAFGTAHRAHASTAGIAEFLPSVAGFLMANEVDELGKLLASPKHPFVALLGGAKISSKLAIVHSLLPHIDTVWIGGAMACTFMKAHGIEVGTSLVEEQSFATALKLETLADEHHVELRLPIDVVVAPSLDATKGIETVDTGDIPATRMVVDIGPKTVAAIAASIAGAATVIWNGPFGVYEHPPFDAGTHGIAAGFQHCHGTSVLGGGDVVAALEHDPSLAYFTHVSTGGGATLEFLEGKELPGIAALLDSAVVRGAQK